MKRLFFQGLACIMITAVLPVMAQKPDTTGRSGEVIPGIVPIDTLRTRTAEGLDSFLKPEGIDRPAYRKISQNAFREGENLVFEVVYGPIHAGTAKMSVPGITHIGDRACFHIRTTAESNAFFSKFYKVRDTVETFIDVDGIFPWRFSKRLREGNYRSDKFVEYDQIRHIAVENRKDTLEVPPFIQGVLSSFYYVRTMDLEVGRSFDIDNYGDNKIYPLRVHVHRKERVRVPAGEFDCIVVEPVMRVEGIFKQKGKLVIWLTDDERRIPVLMKSKILVGSINVQLKSMTLP